MIRFKNAETYGWEAAVRSSRNPLQSWIKSDSFYCRDDYMHEDDCKELECPMLNEWCEAPIDYVIGKADHELLLKLAKAGPDHGKALRMIGVTVDITAPVYFLRELDTYKIGTTCNSTSMMHTGMKTHYDCHSEQFSLNAFKRFCIAYGHNKFFDELGQILNELVDEYSKADPQNREPYFMALREIMPSGFNYTITWSANYAVLRNIYHQRKNHRLSEWSGEGGFCQWIESLPYSALLTEV